MKDNRQVLEEPNAVFSLQAGQPLNVLFVTSQWAEHEHHPIAPFVKREVEALRQGGVEVEVFSYRGGWSPRAYLRAIRDVRACLRKRQYDVVHARFGQCGLVARAQWRVPVVITYGGSDVEGSPVFSGRARYKNYLLRLVSWVLSAFVDEVIVVARHLGEKLPRDDYHIIPSGVDFELFRPVDREGARRQLGLAADKRLVLFAGALDNPRKRYDLAMEACKVARAEMDLELIVLTGKPSSQVPIYMSACDVLLLTSTNEGSPNVVKEALACNLPVVSVNVGDVCERIASIEGCVLCKSSEPEVIASALLTVLRKPRRLASREVIRDLDVAVMTAKIVGIYQKALVKHRRWAASQ